VILSKYFQYIFGNYKAIQTFTVGKFPCYCWLWRFIWSQQLLNKHQTQHKL